MTPVLRHGDLSFFRIDQPADLEGFEAARDASLAGSHGGSHVLYGACLRKVVDARHQLVVIPEDARVIHHDRHITKGLKAGAYQVVVARTAEGLVVD